MKNLATTTIFLFFGIFLSAQTIKVQPYLQNAEPNSIHILWETDEGSESIVEWGLTTDLSESTEGTAFINDGTSQIHDVRLENLTRFTTYYYRVKTGNAISEISKFKTPPFSSDNEPLCLVAMSDMQRDGSQPNKFSEIVEEGNLVLGKGRFVK